MSNSIPLYPPIRVARKGTQHFYLKSDYSELELPPGTDLYIEEREKLVDSLEQLFPTDTEEIVLVFSDDLYKHCNALLSNQCIERFAIFDAKQNLWLCIDDDGEVFWTEEEFDTEIALFLSKQDAEDQISFEEESYVVQTRYLLI